MQIIIGSPDPSFNPIELEVENEHFEKEYYDINELDLSEKLYFYARGKIKGRWPEAEPIIIQNAQCAYYYACYVIRGRWPEAEPHIMQNPEWVYYYARDVIGGRWPEAEQTIKKDKFYSRLYKDYTKCEL